MYFENLVALHISIEKQCTQEMAFKYLDRFTDGNFTGKPVFRWSDEDVEDIKKFKQQGLDCREIAEIYFTTKQAIYGVLRKDKKELPKQPK